MSTRIMLATVVLVNAWAAPPTAKSDVSRLAEWLASTGMDRDDYNEDNAVLIGLKPGEARAKARGVEGREGEPDHYAHLFNPASGDKFIAFKRCIEKEGRDDCYTYKVGINGQLLKAYRLESEIESDDPSKTKLTNLRVNSKTRKAAAEEIAFWSARAKQDAEKKKQQPTSSTP